MSRGAFIVLSIAGLARAQDPSPLAHYEFEGNALDTTGNGLDGIVEGTVGYVSGPVGLALSTMDGTGWIRVPADMRLQLGVNDFTIALWVSFISHLHEEVLIQACPGGCNAGGWTLTSFPLGPSGGTLRNLRVHGACTPHDSQSVDFGLNEFHHVALTRNQGHWTLYVDRCPIHEWDETCDISSGLEPLLIGARLPESQGRNALGMLDDVRIYTVALDPNQISNLVDAGSGCLTGNVDAGSGTAASVLTLNSSDGVVGAAINEPIQLSLRAAPSGPANARYVVWIWRGCAPLRRREVRARRTLIGCCVEPTPFNRSDAPQPFKCLKGTGVPSVACRGTRTLSSPPSAPWTRMRSAGFARPLEFTVQAVLEDNGAANSTGFSVTNAVVLHVQ